MSGKAIQCPTCQKFTPAGRTECLGCGGLLSLTAQQVAESQAAKLVTAQAARNRNSKTTDLVPAADMPVAVTETTVTPAPVVARQEDDLRCPKCKSIHITANTKGFGLGKAAVGGLLLGGVGLLGGFFGSRKIRLTCLKCAHYWSP